MFKKILIGVVLLVAFALGAVITAGTGTFGNHEGAGSTSGKRLSPVLVDTRASNQRRDADKLAETTGRSVDKQILFGDFHVHTTLSTDAFLLSLPVTQGEGAHPPADACDFARFCSALDFWSINDHAEGITPRQWDETVASIRECNENTGDGHPDTVAFLGWEWTQVGPTPETHWGHKNVIVRGVADDEVPARPIASRGLAGSALGGPGVLARGAIALATGGQRMHDLARFFAERASNRRCPDGIDVHALPSDCLESTVTPGELYEKLDQWGFDSIVIPHGTSWGMYTPPGSSWRKQLTKAEHDPNRQTLVEIYSGHGNSEEYRDYRGILPAPDGTWTCPEPTAQYVPSCWRAGEIIRTRCLDEGTPADECDARAVKTRAFAANSGVAGHHVVSGETPDDWLDAGQCRDCFEPSFNHRPQSSVQYMTAIRNFTDDAGPERFRFGFIGSSDNHFARPGTGYKQVHRRGFSESRDFSGAGPTSRLLTADPGEKLSSPVAFDRETTSLSGFQLVELERQASFFMPGGLAAVHAEGRTRDEIWNALARKEVYATSGPRILLWFNLLNAPGRQNAVAMGSAAAMSTNPEFEIRAVGSFEQKPGCPNFAGEALGAARLEHLCKGECYFPSDQRRQITRIEIVRIRPQLTANEDLGALIEDPWRTFDCEPNAEGCAVTFEDPDFAAGARDVVYYARAIEEESLAINAGGVRCDYDAEGNCTRVHRCGTPETAGSECLAPAEERAWSSPIFVDWARATGG